MSSTCLSHSPDPRPPNNYEEHRGTPEDEFRAGLNIYDLSDPRKPQPLHFWATDGQGVHRFSFDGRYAYLSTTVEGYFRAHRRHPRSRRADPASGSEALALARSAPFVKLNGSSFSMPAA